MAAPKTDRKTRGQHRYRPVVCVVSPSEADYSQTFVREHIRRLPARVLPLYGGSTSPPAMNPGAFDRLREGLFQGDFYPNRRAGGERLVSMPGKVLDLAISRLSGTPAPPIWQRSLRRFLTRNGIEAVLAEFGWSGVSVMRACAACHIPLIVHFHGADAYKTTWLNRFRKLYPEMFRLASALVVVSKDMREQLLRLGAPAQKVFYNPYGVDVEVFDGSDTRLAPPTFLTVGRFVPKKAPDLTLRAFRSVVREHPESRLVMIGEGPLRASCEARVHRWGIEDQVTFTGVCPPAQVAAAMQGVRAFVQHSVRADDGDCEGTPLSVLEACASGLPVIATRHGGIPDVIRDGETGLLVDEGDVDGMARHMKLMIESPALAAEIGTRARAHVRAAHSIETSIAGLMSVIGDAVALQGAGSAKRD